MKPREKILRRLWLVNERLMNETDGRAASAEGHSRDQDQCVMVPCSVVSICVFKP